MAKDDASKMLTPGAALRAARVDKHLSVAAAAEALRSREALITALENDDYSFFSADLYARGFIRNYARIVGLDPDPLLTAYQDEYAKNDPDVMNPSQHDVGGITLAFAPKTNVRALIVAAVVAVMALITVVSVVIGGRAPDTASVDDVVDVAPEPAPAPDVVDPNTNETPEPEPVAPVSGVELVLAFEQASWMQVFVDGVLVLEETVRAGETLQYRGDEVRVRFGNAGGVFAELNGTDLGVQGGRGEVINVRYTRDGADVS